MAFSTAPDRTVILGSLWVGVISGALCGLVLSLLFGVRLPIAYFFSILVYSAVGGLGALVLSAILVRLADASGALKISAGLVAGLFAFFALGYWGNKWLLASNPFTSPSSVTFDFGALVVSILVGVVVAWRLARWLGGSEKPLGRLGLATLAVCIVVPAIALLGISIAGAPPGAPASEGKPSILLISIDALRADHLGCYGYPRNTTPVADRLAEEGVRFEQAFCPVPSTGPSHATMLTGLRPETHRLRRNGHCLSDSVVTLAEILSKAGYSTGGFTTNVLLDDRFGFTQGFDTYVESGHVEKLRPVTWSLLVQTLAAKEIIDKLVAQYSGGEDQTILSAAKWLRENYDKPFFLFLHLIDPHDPYQPLEPYRSKFPGETEGLAKSLWVELGRDPETLGRQISLYDGEVAAADAKLGRLLQVLKDRAVKDRTLIVYTADHGENMGDHEPFFRHADVYDSSIRVPLILRFPGVLEAGRTVREVVENSAIFPTILSLAGHEIPEGLEGEDLVPLIRGGRERTGRFALSNSGRNWALRTHFWKIRIDFKDGSRRLYDLVNDPDEAEDLFEAELEIGEEMEALLLAEIQRLEGGLPGAEDEESPFEGLDHRTRERLKALGYIQ
jgi:arylsulfatase A-like enzyme